MRMLSCVVLVLFVMPALPAVAWNRTGHRVIATIAYDELTPATRQRVDSLLRAHPRYQNDLLGTMEDGHERESRFAFGIAAFWPDIIRSPGNPMHFAHNKPQWHGIHVRYEMSDWKPAATTPATSQAAGPARPSRKRDADEPKNVVEAIAWCKSRLRDPDVSDADKAVAICWLAHLVGDIHQPLHATTLYSAQFPDGDNAGNRFIVRHRGDSENLHRVWDQMLGLHDSVTMVGYLADAIRRDPKLQPDALPEVSKLDTETWVAESHALGRSAVHLDGKLQGVNSDALRENPEMAVPALPPEYGQRSEEIAIRRAALAGRRLAAVLEATLGNHRAQ